MHNACVTAGSYVHKLGKIAWYSSYAHLVHTPIFFTEHTEDLGPTRAYVNGCLSLFCPV